MLSIRFQRVGKKNQPRFRIVVQDKRLSPKSGKVKAIVGWWDPIKKIGEFKKEEIEKYLNYGAEITDSVWNLLIKKGILKGKKRKISITKKKTKQNQESS